MGHDVVKHRLAACPFPDLTVVDIRIPRGQHLQRQQLLAPEVLGTQVMDELHESHHRPERDQSTLQPADALALVGCTHLPPTG